MALTTPKIPTFHRGGSRYYVHPETQEKVPGVTSVLGMLPKPFLKAWAAKSVAQTAVAMGGELAAMAARDPEGAVDYLKRSPDRDTRKAADTGTAAHGLFEALAKGEKLGPVTEDLLPYVRHFEDFLAKTQPEYLRQEDTVWSTTHSYAGSFDALARFGGVPAWVDNKTTRSGVHAEVALQLSAYAHADYLLDGETGDQLLLPKAEHGLVLHVRPEGWALYEVPIGDEVFDFFLALRKVHVWDSQASRGIPGKPLFKGAGVAA